MHPRVVEAPNAPGGFIEAPAMDSSRGIKWHAVLGGNLFLTTYYYLCSSRTQMPGICGSFLWLEISQSPWSCAFQAVQTFSVSLVTELILVPRRHLGDGVLLSLLARLLPGAPDAMSRWRRSGSCGCWRCSQRWERLLSLVRHHGRRGRAVLHVSLAVDVEFCAVVNLDGGASLHLLLPADNFGLGRGSVAAATENAFLLAAV
jgi:hypothetical protein